MFITTFSYVVILATRVEKSIIVNIYELRIFLLLINQSVTEVISLSDSGPEKMLISRNPPENIVVLPACPVADRYPPRPTTADSETTFWPEIPAKADRVTTAASLTFVLMVWLT